MQDQKKYRCFCCGYYIFEENIILNHDICSVCFWENDGVQNLDFSYSGGANLESLYKARENFKLLGAKNQRSLQYVRKPLEEEKDGLDEWVDYSYGETKKINTQGIVLEVLETKSDKMNKMNKS